jgi:glycosyltransferase involved in cell wall biosynthesis
MRSKQKTFIVLTPGFAASEADTTCLPMQQTFVKSISKVYPEVEIIVLSFQYPFCRKTYKWFDATVTSFNGRNKGGVSGIFLRRRVNRTLTRIHKSKQVIGLLSFWLGECAYVGKKFAEKNAVTHYCWLFGQDAKTKNKYVGTLSMKGNDMVALSDFLQDEFERNYGIKPFAVIPPGVGEISLNNYTRDIDLLAVGSLIPLKQFHIFIESVAAIKKHYPATKAMLVGDGPERSRLEKLISDLDIENNITLTGNIDHEKVLKLMQRTRILLHPSSYEGFSGVCQEALSNGAHVISFCRAMKKDVSQWHIVQSKNDMIEKAMTILGDKSAAFNKIDFQSMDTTAKQIMEHYL